MCQALWAKLCAAPLPETRTTSQVAESKELKSQLFPHSGQLLQKTSLGAIKDINVCDTRIASTGNTKLPLPCMFCVIPSYSFSFFNLFVLLFLFVCFWFCFLSIILWFWALPTQMVLCAELQSFNLILSLMLNSSRRWIVHISAPG